MRKTIKNFIPDREMLGEVENCLFEELGGFFSFSSLAIYYPPEMEKMDTTFLPDEKVLLAPVRWQGSCLGMLRFDGINPGRLRRILAILPALVSSMLEKCLIKRMLVKEFDTGLVTEEEFFESFAEDLEKMEDNFANQNVSVNSLPIYRICKGLIVLSWRDGRTAAQDYDYQFYELVWTTLGKHLKSLLPPSAIAARLGKHEGRQEFGIIFNTSSRNACHTLARKLLLSLENREFPDPLGQRPYHASFYAGHALYPQDMRGEELRLPPGEQAMRLRDRARLGIRAAIQGAGCSNGKIMGFSSILRKGGMIIASLGKGKYRINLGLAANARVGMRFILLGRTDNLWRPKGHMVILELGIMDSIATIVSMNKVGELPETGDRLIEDSCSSVWKIPENMESETGRNPLCSQAGFVNRFPVEASKSLRYILGIARTRKERPSGEDMRNLLENVAERGTVDLIAPFGNNGFSFFLKEDNLKNAESFIADLLNLTEKQDFLLEIGMFDWPFLNFSRAESEECALKALEYASLLPYPHVGYFNSMAIAIGADRKLAMGDNFGALEEYKLALLADSHNTMARNSMGVCLAGLGKYEEARKIFEMALEDVENTELSAKIHYNLGMVFQKMENHELARSHYRKCLDRDESYIFAWLRLGQLAEDKGARNRARKYYLAAAARIGADSSLFNTVQRHLARLEASGNKNEQARGILHDNLVRNPDDVASMAMLAKLYLEKNIDPLLAEMLARKCANLSPRPDYWNLLADALQAQNRNEEAEMARGRARNR